MKTRKLISIFISLLMIFGILSTVSAGGATNNQEKKRMAQPDRVTEQVSPGNLNDNGLKVQVQSNRDDKRGQIGKNANAVDGFIGKFDARFTGKTKAEQKVKYELLYSKIDPTLDKIDISDMSDEKKQAYRNIFEYIRVVLDEKINSLN